MKRVVLSAGFLLLGITAAQAIDCAKAATDIETAICADPAAMTADAALNAAYQSAVKLLAPKDAKVLASDQRDWNALASDCLTTVDDSGNASHATPHQIGACLVDRDGERTRYLSGAPPEGRGAPDPLAPVVLGAYDGPYAHVLRFVKPASAGEQAYNAALDAALKDVHPAKADGDNSDTLDETLSYASPSLISARFDGDYMHSASPKPYNFVLTIDLVSGRRLKTADAIDAKAAARLDQLCAAQLKDFVAAGTEGSDLRRADIKTMTGNIDFWTFGAHAAIIRFVDDQTQDDPPTCTLGYDALRPLLEPGFPLPQ